RVLEHQRGEVHDLRAHPLLAQVLAEREEAQWVLLVDRGDVDAVRVRQVGEQHVVALAEVEHAGRVQQDEVGSQGAAGVSVRRAPRGPPATGAAATAGSSRSRALRSIFPVEVFGRTGRNSTASGTM